MTEKNKTKFDLPNQIDMALLPSLIGFNLGIEFGQLIVIGAAWLTVGQFRHRKWYRSRVVIPASVFIALIAGVWIVERLS